MGFAQKWVFTNGPVCNNTVLLPIMAVLENTREKDKEAVQKKTSSVQYFIILRQVG